MTKHVLVAGSLHYDLVVNAEKFPVVDEYLPGQSLRYMPGGKGGNQAIASARNGVVTWFAGRAGDDEAGGIVTASASKDRLAPLTTMAPKSPNGLTIATLAPEISPAPV